MGGKTVSENRRTLDAMIGLATVGSGVTGIASFILALLAFLNADFAAGGTLMLAAALSFGLLANAVLRG
jgi:hypothetical protein